MAGRDRKKNLLKHLEVLHNLEDHYLLFLLGLQDLPGYLLAQILSRKGQIRQMPQSLVDRGDLEDQEIQDPLLLLHILYPYFLWYQEDQTALEDPAKSKK